MIADREELRIGWPLRLKHLRLGPYRTKITGNLLIDVAYQSLRLNRLVTLKPS